jgi:hypothetical protein
VRKFADWLKEYLSFTSESEAPDIFHFWTGVSTIAGALRRKVWIEQLYFQWTPNFYIVLVAPPGIAAKSTAMGIGMSLLREVDGIHMGPNSLTWQGLTMALQDAQTILQLDEATFQPISCLTCALSELGTFLKPQDTALVDLLVDLWDGQIRPWKHKTRTMGEVSIMNPWMNIIGCVTPAWLRQNFPAYLIEGGLVSRIVFVHAEKKKQLVPYPANIVNVEKFKSHAAALVDDLREIAELQGPYTLRDDAIEWGEAWYKSHWSGRPGTAISDRHSGYLARKQTHMHKLAMVIAAAQRNELFITRDDLLTAERLLRIHEEHLGIIFETVGVPDIGKQIHEVLAVIRAAEAITSQQLMQILSDRMSSRQLDEVMVTLTRGGEVQTAIVEGKIGYRFVGAVAGPQGNLAE